MSDAACAGDIYQWRDASGTVHFSDVPPGDGAKVTTLDSQTAQPVAAEARARRRAAEDAGAESAGDLERADDAPLDGATEHRGAGSRRGSHRKVRSEGPVADGGEPADAPSGEIANDGAAPDENGRRVSPHRHTSDAPRLPHSTSSH